MNNDETNKYLTRMTKSRHTLREFIQPKTVKQWLFVIKWSWFDRKGPLRPAKEGEFYSKDAIKYMKMKLDLMALNDPWSEYNRQRLQHFLSLKDEPQTKSVARRKKIQKGEQL
jgi:hypothetical protein